MSIAAIAWVFSQKIKPSWLKFLLVALADNANDSGEAWPSQAGLIKKTDLDLKTIKKGLRELQRRRLIEDTGERRGETKSVKVYRLLGDIRKLDRARTKSAHGPSPSVPEASPSVPIEPSEPSKTLSFNGKRKPSGLDEVKNYGKELGISDTDAEGFFDSQEAGGWTRNGRPLKDWKAAFRTWKRNGWLPSQKRQFPNTAPVKREPRVEKGMGWT